MAEEAHGEKKAEGASGGHGEGGGGHGGGGHGGGGHGGGGHEEAHEGAPEWLISFADNVALLMGFFVILLAMNMGPKAEPVQGGAKGENGGGAADPAMDAIIGIREAFRSPLNPGDPDDAKVLRYKMMRDSGRANEPGVPGTFTNVQALEPHNFKNVTGSVIFDNNSSLISPTARKTIGEVATRLRDQRWIIDVRGHVSPFESMRDNTKAMNLSHERAMAAAQALVEAGLKWENLRVVACGSNDRVVARTYDAQEDRSNQRVEFVVTNETTAADPYSRDAAPAKGKAEAGGAPATPGAPEPASAPEPADNNPGEH